MQDSLYSDSTYFYNCNIYSPQVIISLFWKVFQIRPSLYIVDSVRVVKFVAEFAVVVAADDNFVLVIIFGHSLPHFQFSFPTLLPHGLLQLFSLKYVNVSFPVVLDIFVPFTSPSCCYRLFVSARVSKAFFLTSSTAAFSFSAFWDCSKVLGSNSASASLIFLSRSSNKFSVNVFSFSFMPVTLTSAEIFVLYGLRIKLNRLLLT